ncbi:MAG TPA: sigma factor-like helix-turn-helix DNA-binding protein [Baekduia sp.]|uniref:sigma factor-like helix-turn-helix DNA-binding protein n=1 Tax=Baekduia sp. TaxID=2600305 RepID=UPI002D768B77|nr:sigma factor-like helix-turn-helix DNA-binding protein [Baekduia sp.]HET6506362.1 sigma factor-like helix-turn-helix DNA-binding protein [Baekduia sp.]
MARFDDLPADQKAVLQLVLRQGRTYAEIAGLLKISEAAVQNRALTALDAIGPSGTGLDDERQDEVGDYLLGQQSASERAATRDFLEANGSARDWARQVASELRGAGVAGEELPEIPADPAEVDEAFDALHARREARVQQQRSSRLGGVLILAAVVIVLAGGVLLLTGVIGGSDDNGSKDAADVSTTTDASSTANANTQATVEKQFNLTPPNGGSKPLGVANLVSQSGKRALAVVGQDLPASGHYVLWLRDGGKVKFLGFFPIVTGKGSDKGRLQGLVEAPSDLASYSEMLITREASSTPKAPTTIVLKGSLTG